MRLVLSWLREFVPVEAETGALAERLTLAGLAVEEVIRTGEGIKGVVVGEVRAVREHPNADNLVLVRAFDGSAERDIVCGARNFAPGDRVPIALPGARLPGGIEIARRTVRGETSDGMLCSSRELQVSEDHSGIMLLDADAPLGEDLVDALGLDDVVFHLDITTNRPDLLSVVGVAREVAALYGLPLTVPTPEVAEEGAEAATLATVRVEDNRGCPRYLARVIEGVSPAASPWWMRRRILASGMRPISGVVDVTNYVLLERGHPLHAFDLDRLGGREIVVRRPRSGESLETLDGEERKLARDDIVICDADRPVAVAGVMGGADSEVSGATTRILLESAYFDPLRVRRTAARLGMRTEASVRFERGADPEAVPAAADRAAQLIAEISGGRVARGALDEYPKPRRARPIRLRADRANALLGTSLEVGEMASILGALGCDVEATRKVLRATPPTWRPDLSIEDDLVEEVARLHGFDRIPETLPSGARIGGLTEAQRRRRRARDLLLGAGLSEAVSLSLLPPWLADRLALPDDAEMRRALRVSNPLSEEESVLRPSLVPGLLLSAQRNAARRVLPVTLFEIGTVFRADGERVAESTWAAWVLTGPAPVGWHGPGRDLDFFDAKGVLEALLEGLGVTGWRIEAPPRDADTAPLHPGRAAHVLVDGATSGFVGELAPAAAEALDLPARVAVGAVDLGALAGRAPEPGVRVAPRVPAVWRDLALIVPEDVPSARVAETVARAAGPLLEDLRLFDVYRGEPVPDGHVSLAWALTLRDPERTLTDEDADRTLRAVTAAAAAAGWTVRD